MEVPPAATPPQDAARDRRLRLLAVLVAGLALLLCGAAVTARVLAARDGVDLENPLLGDLVLGALFPLAGAVVAWRQPRNACGWVLLSAALVAVSALSQTWVELEVERPGTLPLLGVAVWLAGWTYVPYWLQTTLLPVLFPDGRLPSERWRLHVRAVLVVFAVLAVAAAFKPDTDVEGLGLANPLGVGGLPIEAWAVAQFGSTMALLLVGTPVALLGMAVRLRKARGKERAQLQWLLLGLSALPLYAAASALVPPLGSELAFSLAFACIPLSLAVAVLRHQLLDVDVVVHRTVVYALLTGSGLLAYVGLVALAGRYVSGDGAGPVVAALVVAVAASARTRLQSLVDRRLFGSRRDPYAVVQQVGASTAQAQAPGEALVALVTAVRDALRLPFVQVLDDAGEVAAEAGAPVAGTHVVPVVDAGRQVGVLVVGRRSRNERLRSEEASALVEVARRAGALLSARRRDAQVVEVREQERLRLRRDLHDGVGPSLAGVALQLEGLAERLQGDPALAARAERARDRLLTTVGEVRRIVDDLKPVAVEQLGLEAALRGLATDEGDPVRVAVDVDVPADLPAALEVAAYRIAGEAVTNALRHAAAREVRVDVRLRERELRVEVRDDGAGLPVPVQPGVGLVSMQQRAREVGGRLEVAPAEAGGTRVLAVLPA